MALGTHEPLNIQKLSFQDIDIRKSKKNALCSEEELVFKKMASRTKKKPLHIFKFLGKYLKKKNEYL